jgi:hypothetical protein
MAFGRGAEALRILEDHYRKGTSSTDALGVLAGRLKRRWLAERRAADLERARQLYSEGLSRAEAEGDAAQAYYHAINIAFLDLMAASATAGVPARVREMAERALHHSGAAEEDHWRLARGRSRLDAEGPSEGGRTLRSGLRPIIVGRRGETQCAAQREGVKLRSLQDGIDPSTSMGKAMLQIGRCSRRWNAT